MSGLHGKRDGFESYTVHFLFLLPTQALITGLLITLTIVSPAYSSKIPGKAHLDPSFARPSLLTDRLPSVTAFFAQVHHIMALLLSSLSSSLGLPQHSSLTSLHRANVPSADILRFLHYIAQPEFETGIPQIPHTDLGSLTLLFTKSPGLQVWHPHSEQWTSLSPRRGCAVVNIGDGMFLQHADFIMFNTKMCPPLWLLLVEVESEG